MQVTGELLTISQAAKLFPIRPNVATVWRWTSNGVRGVILNTRIVGGRRYVTQADIDAFLDALNSPRTNARPVSASAASAKASAELAAAGF